VNNGTNLSSCVDNLGREILTLVPDLFAEGIFDGGVVALDKMAVDVSNSEGGFACERIEVNRWPCQTAMKRRRK